MRKFVHVVGSTTTVLHDGLCFLVALLPGIDRLVVHVSLQPLFSCHFTHTFPFYVPVCVLQVVSGQLGPTAPSKQLKTRLEKLGKGKGAEHATDWVAQGSAAPAADAGAIVYDDNDFADYEAAAEQEAAAQAEQQQAAASKPPASKKARRR